MLATLLRKPTESENGWMACGTKIARLEADRLEVQRVQAELESVQRQLAEHNELKVELDAQIEERKQALADLVLKVNGLKNEVNELTATASNWQTYVRIWRQRKKTAQRAGLGNTADA